MSVVLHLFDQNTGKTLLLWNFITIQRTIKS